MRRLNDTRRRWFRLRARYQAARQGPSDRRQGRAPIQERPIGLPKPKDYHQTARAWDGAEIFTVEVDRAPWIPPKVLCFEQNPEETLQFLAFCRDRARIRTTDHLPDTRGWIGKPRGRSRRPRISSFIDFSKVERISTAVALIIAADYDRQKQLISKVPPTINLLDWSDPIFTKFYQLGFFDIVGLTSRIRRDHEDDGVVRTMRIETGTNSQGLESAAEGLLKLNDTFMAGHVIPDEIAIALNSALSEAMSNVAWHAYPADHEFEFRHVGSWWVTATVDREQETLTVVIYDQGATIPVTYPSKATSSRVLEFLARVRALVRRHDYDDDGAYIEAAMEYGNTQTKEPNRGKGIHDMKQVIDLCQRGRLTIHSRGGRCEYAPGQGTKRTSFPYSVGGTLIEWVIQLPEPDHA